MNEVDFLHEIDLPPQELNQIRAELALRRTAELVPVRVQTKEIAVREKPKRLVPKRNILPAVKISLRVSTLGTALYMAGYAASASVWGQRIAIGVAIFSLLLFIGAPGVAWLLSGILEKVFSGKTKNPCGRC